jgi:hypothetical protein
MGCGTIIEIIFYRLLYIAVHSDRDFSLHLPVSSLNRSRFRSHALAASVVEL